MSPTPLDSTRRSVYGAMNAGVVPLWLAMIVVPRSRLTRTLVRRAVPLHAGFSVGYAGLLGRGVLRSRRMLDFGDPDALRGQLTDGDVFLAAWSHYLTFDLLVGQWIWQDALDRGRTARLALLLTWLAGPVGHGLYLLQRRAS
ncbi:ABA4-like family protein [Nocardioides sp. LHD-245]|uniref:ABA4-like family protein n=1 Tax=Nocardioides sp. LHD-245 TaxID=3051387 RepID=UPI0027E095D3|nr:ABA4-like family protein [Nocardioides sp. LHD-245]